MNCSVIILGLPPSAGCAPGKTWRAAAEYVETRLAARFGLAVRFTYVDLFSAGMGEHPELETLVAEGMPLPIVMIEGVPRFSGEKLNVTAIERAVADALSERVPVATPMEVPFP